MSHLEVVEEARQAASVNVLADELGIFALVVNDVCRGVLLLQTEVLQGAIIARGVHVDEVQLLPPRLALGNERLLDGIVRCVLLQQIRNIS